MPSISNTILRSFLATIAASLMTATIFYAAAGPDPNEDRYLPPAEAAEQFRVPRRLA